MKMVFQILATLACGMFAGAAFYVTLVEQPARLSCGVAAAIAEWRPSYRRGTRMQAALAVGGSVLAFLAWWMDRDSTWLVGGVLLFAVVPFTLIVIFPINRELESSNLDLSSSKTEWLLRRWGMLHAVRGGLSLAAFLMFLLALHHKS
jgi:uncharacterized membrane protein